MVSRVSRLFDDLPIVELQLGEEGIAIDLRVNQRQVNAIDRRQSLTIEFTAADDERLVVALRQAYCLVHAVSY